MTQPPVAPPVAPTTNVIYVRWIVSALEWIAFLAALILQVLGYHTDAVTTALGGAFAHGLIHN